MTRDDLIYIAALLDGEGWISAARRRRKDRQQGGMYVLTVGIVNTHEPTIRYLHGLLGGSLIRTHKERMRVLWRWQVQQGIARDFLRHVLPFMRIKREQALLAIELWALVDQYKEEIKHSCNLGRVLPEQERIRRDRVVACISHLNRYGCAA